MRKLNKRVEQKLLFNSQLKERNQNLTQEAAAQYSLRCKHKKEQDLLEMDWQTTKFSRAALAEQQAQEWSELRQQCIDKRADILQQHGQVRALLDQHLSLLR